MDTPVTRTKQQIIRFYAGVLSEQFELTDSQEDAVEAALAFACSEMEDRSAAARADLHATQQQQADLIVALNAEILRLHTDLNNLRNEHFDQARGMERVCAEPQEPKTNQVAPPSHEPEDPPAMPQQLAPATPAEAKHRRGGRKPGSKNKPRLSADDIALQIEDGQVPQVATIDRSLISDDPNGVALHGRLRREESHVTTRHGMPVRVTRQYIEIR